jgi:molybdate transport system substrate-binding protein
MAREVFMHSGFSRLRAALQGLCRIALLAALAAAAAAQAASVDVPSPQSALLVYAAASLTDALEEVDAAFTRQTGIPVKASFAASSVLAKQIEAGAPADVFFAAERAWMDYLEQRGLLKRGSRHDLLGNALVLVAPADSTVRLKIAPGFDLVAALGGGRLATADPDSVPAGQYARAALTALGVWQSLSGHLVRAENVRAALEYVARGDAPLGIVYRTDAQVEKRVRVVDVFPADTHPPIVYPVALTAGAGAQAQRFTAFLSSAAARAIFVRQGFVVLTPQGTAP